MSEQGLDPLHTRATVENLTPVARAEYFRGYYPDTQPPPNVAEKNAWILKAIGVMV